jgi:hypothetical protein
MRHVYHLSNVNGINEHIAVLTIGLSKVPGIGEYVDSNFTAFVDPARERAGSG